MKKSICIIMLIITLANAFAINATAEQGQVDLGLTAEAAIIMEPESGKIIYEKNSHKQLYPASVTKIMTMLLIFEALDNGTLSLEDKVTASEHASSMGGSQIWLEPGEQLTVETLLKCICIASANDAAVAMAEHLGGTEQGFVQLMNDKAAELGMKDTEFKNACGLDDNIEGHLTSAYDIALMSRELIIKYPQVFEYSTIWMENITHVSSKGEFTFGLTNTNKLLKTYNGITGLKTGSTSKAKYCLSATAKRGDLQMIAVVLAASDPKVRFKEAANLLDYGFANCKLYKDNTSEIFFENIKVTGGQKNSVAISATNNFSYAGLKNENVEGITSQLVLNKKIKAPVKKGEVVGVMEYRLDGEVVGEVNIYAMEDVKKSTFSFSLGKILRKFFK